MMPGLASRPVGWTYCSGIGAPEVAPPWVDWRLASEIEDFPREVLRQRFGYQLPEGHNQGDPLLWGDFTQVDPALARSRGVQLPDLLVAGTPCQAFSVAGLRRGVADDRGNLTLKFVENCHAIVDARSNGRLVVVWENVVGVLSDANNAFGCFLGGLIGADDPLRTPDGASWPGAGMVAGPRARVAWRVFNAKHFRVAQQRRRVFVVVDFGGGADPAAVLFERAGVPGSFAPGDSAPEKPAPGFAAGAAVCGHGGHLVPSGLSVDPVVCMTGGITHTLTSEGHDASEDGTGRGVPIVPCLAYALNAGGNNRQDISTETLISSFVGPLMAGGRGLTGQAADQGHIIADAIAFNARQDPDSWRDHTWPLDQLHNSQAVAVLGQGIKWGVRRLLPVEGHRLQGFPDDHCAIDCRGKPAPSGRQFKALGNSMAVPNVAWILERVAWSAGWSDHLGAA